MSPLVPASASTDTRYTRSQMWHELERWCRTYAQTKRAGDILAADAALAQADYWLDLLNGTKGTP